MTSEDIFRRVEWIMKIKGYVAPSSMDSRLEDLGVDSLDSVELALDIEDDLKIDLDDAEIAKAQSVGDLVKLASDALIAKVELQASSQPLSMV